MNATEQQCLKEQQAKKQKDKALLASRIRKLLDEGLSTSVICERTGMASRSLRQLIKLSGWRVNT